MPELDDLSSDLVVHASRLIRDLRSLHDLPAGTRVLSLLDERGDLTVTALAEADRCSQPTMSAQVTALQQRGLVGKRPHATDARSSVVSLTPAGRAELSDVRRTNGRTVASRIAAHPSLTTDDLRTAVAVLRGLLDPVAVTAERGTS